MAFKKRHLILKGTASTKTEMLEANKTNSNGVADLSCWKEIFPILKFYTQQKYPIKNKNKMKPFYTTKLREFATNWHTNSNIESSSLSKW